MKVTTLRGTFQQRLSSLRSDSSNDYNRGSIAMLEWALTELETAILETLPPGMDLNTLENESVQAAAGDPDVGSHLAASLPARFSKRPCKPERTHAYQFNTPSKGYKRCPHCLDIQPMSHGEKISTSKRKPTARQEVWQLATAS